MIKININKTITVNDHIKPIRIEFSDNNTYCGDTAVTIYDDYKISLVLTDDCGAVIGDKIFFPKRGDVMLFRPDEIHFGRFPNPNNYRFISFLIPVDFFEHCFSSSKAIISPFLDCSANKLNLICLPEKYKKRMIDLTEELFSLLKENNDTSCFDIIAFAKLTEALNICSICYPLQKSVAQKSSVPFIVTKTMQLIEDKFPDFIGLSTIAKHCGCSVTYLTHTFRHYTGKSIHNYLTERRLEHARKQLQNGSSVTEACYLSGFFDCSQFISRFKKHYGITPGKYKNECIQ
jgi:AraC-like DNA-binding protein